MVLYYLRKIIMFLYNIIYFREGKLSSIFSPLSSAWLHHPPATSNSLRRERSGRGWRAKWMLGGGEKGREGEGSVFSHWDFWFKMRQQPCFSIVFPVTTLIFLSISSKHSCSSLDIMYKASRNTYYHSAEYIWLLLSFKYSLSSW